MSKYKVPVALGLIITTLTSCGGSDNGSGSNNVVTIPPTSPTSPPPPPPPPTTASTCDGMDMLDIIGATADQASGAFVASNAIDDNLDPISRWGASSVPAALTLDLGAQFLIRDVGVAWHLGDQRTSTFSLEVSDDGVNFTTLQSSTTSAGDTLSFERYDVADTAGRFVRITGTGNSDSNPFAVVEAALFGCALSADHSITATAANVDTTVFGLDPSLTPGGNFELIDWALDTPEVDPSDGLAQRTQEGLSLIHI